MPDSSIDNSEIWVIGGERITAGDAIESGLLSPSYIMAHKALLHAAKRISESEVKAHGPYQNTRAKYSRSISGPLHTVNQTLDLLARDKITPGAAMSVLWDYDVLNARTQ